MESNAQQTSEGKAVVAVFAAVLERLVKSNSHVSNTENVTKFHALKAPAISIKHYLERVSPSF
jgi:single-stranded DNA-binding protein